MSYFLEVKVLSHKHGLSQHSYITNLLTHMNMLEAKLVLTPIPNSNFAISLMSDSPIFDPMIYHKVVEILQYLSLQR